VARQCKSGKSAEKSQNLTYVGVSGSGYRSGSNNYARRIRTAAVTVAAGSRQFRQARLWARRTSMNDTLSLAELNDRIAVLRDNLRQLVEQAAGASGSQNEERTADRIAQQEDELNKLILERDGRAKK
jgi:hypothetical protein